MDKIDKIIDFAAATHENDRKYFNREKENWNEIANEPKIRGNPKAILLLKGLEQFASSRREREKKWLRLERVIANVFVAVLLGRLHGD